MGDDEMETEDCDDGDNDDDDSDGGHDEDTVHWQSPPAQQAQFPCFFSVNSFSCSKNLNMPLCSAFHLQGNSGRQVKHKTQWTLIQGPSWNSSFSYGFQL